MKEQSYFESIMEGLQQAVDFKNGDNSKCRVRMVTIPDVEPVSEYSKEQIKELRIKNNFTQKTFADVLGVSAKSVEAWEAGIRKPTGTANRLFQLIEREPSVINYVVKF
ncbi:MAG: helix-turn-helix domain-containing protein [Treponema sp.]|nr:helix-turn-helix domain-containing protein [Treponema sp.]